MAHLASLGGRQIPKRPVEGGLGASATSLALTSPSSPAMDTCAKLMSCCSSSMTEAVGRSCVGMSSSRRLLANALSLRTAGSVSATFSAFSILARISPFFLSSLASLQYLKASASPGVLLNPVLPSNRNRQSLMARDSSRACITWKEFLATKAAALDLWLLGNILTSARISGETSVAKYGSSSFSKAGSACKEKYTEEAVFQVFCILGSRSVASAILLEFHPDLSMAKRSLASSNHGLARERMS
mmetsp:Transcript_369/g.2872  ORF Transcript_369/g.2872 Transcript_369/m.2872 type:complete len:244 (-) Transcript_369:386-1117(-)